MIYSKIYLNKGYKIPSIVYILIIVIIIFILNIFFSKSITPTKATNSNIVRKNIVNISPTQIGIYWQTSSKQPGWVMYGDKSNSLLSIAHDERDFQNNYNSYYNHYVIIKNLKENKKFYYNIIGDNKILLKNNESFTTPANVINNSGAKLAYGKVLQSNGQGLENAIVLLSVVDGTYDLATISKSSGEWLIPLKTISHKTLLKIEVIGSNNEISTIKTNIDNVAPLPQSIIIGKNYDFTNQDVLAAEDSKKVNIKFNQFDIIFPKENAIIPAKNPLIKGVAQPNREILILIKANSTYSTKVISDKDGIWRVILTENLYAGKYKIIASMKNNENKQIEIERNFDVGKSGEQVMGDATGEAQLTLTPTVTPLVTTIPYASPTTVISNNPTAIPTEPVTGSNFNYFIIGSASLIVFGLGLLLAF